MNKKNKSNAANRGAPKATLAKGKKLPNKGKRNSFSNKLFQNPLLKSTGKVKQTNKKGKK